MSFVQEYRKSAAIGIPLIALAMLITLVVSIPVSVEAADDPIFIFGYVTDSLGNPVEGASVTMTIVGKSAQRTDTTDAAGGYDSTPNFGPSDYAIGDTVRVIATKDGHTGQTDHVITSDESTIYGEARVDVQIMDYVIPEFGSATGFVIVAGVVCVVGLMAFSRKRK